MVPTLTLPFATTIPDGVEAYTLSYTSGDKATATPVATTLPAHTPVLINADGGSYTFTATGTVESEAVTTPQSGSLIGAYVLTNVPTDSYVLQNNNDKVGFYKVTSEAPQQINPFRAYLTAGSEARMLGIGFDGEITGISALQNDTERMADDRIFYDLQGRRVAQPSKGLYIVNGKKVMVK